MSGELVNGWQIARECRWSAIAGELPQRHTHEDGTNTLTLSARIDRLDHGESGYAIIDYKTGRVPGLADVLAGEHVQLPFYALAIDRSVAQALYLDLSGARVPDKTKLEGHSLSTLVEKVRTRLVRLYGAMRSGASLPAWGDDDTCLRCPMQGLCRKEMWQGDVDR